MYIRMKGALTDYTQELNVSTVWGGLNFHWPPCGIRLDKKSFVAENRDKIALEIVVSWLHNCTRYTEIGQTGWMNCLQKKKLFVTCQLFMFCHSPAGVKILTTLGERGGEASVLLLAEYFCNAQGNHLMLIQVMSFMLYSFVLKGRRQVAIGKLFPWKSSVWAT